MLDFDINEFKKIKETVNTLPPKGIEVLNLVFLQKIAKQGDALNKILEVLKYNKTAELNKFTVETLKKMCIDLKIDSKEFKVKEDYVTAIGSV